MLGGPVAFELAIVSANKARVFPGTTFVVGFDTAARLIDPRFMATPKRACTPHSPSCVRWARVFWSPGA